jgi:GntR family transcriptional regulator
MRAIRTLLRLLYCTSYLLCYGPSYMTEPIIEFHLDAGSGLPPYQQVVRQVRQALRLGVLREGDQLPTVKDVVARLAINPNTVLKAYRELEHDGLVAARPGVGTFVTRTLADATLAAHGPLRRDLVRWLAKARLAGLDDESIEALFMTTFRTAAQEDVA